MTDRISTYKTNPATSFFVEGDLLSQSTAGNYSIVRCYLKAINGPGASSGSTFAGFGFHEGHIDQVERFARKEGNPFLPSGVANEGLRWRLGPYDVRIDHDSDGSHTPIRFAQVLNYGSVNETLFSGYIDLPTIPRASKATFSTGTFDAGSAVTINTNRASSGFTHDITWTFGSLSGTVANGVGASTSWTPPLSLLSQIPNATSGIGGIRVITKSGSNVVGTTTTKYTLRAPASLVPTVNSLGVSDTNTTVATVVGRFVQGLSRAKFTVGGAGVQGSTIVTREVTFQGGTVADGADVLTTVAGATPLTARVIDSRGRVGTSPSVLNVMPYVPPSASTYQARRCDAAGAVFDDGTFLRVDLTAAVASLINTTERNTLTIRAFTRPRGTTAWTERNTIAPGGLSYSSWFLVSGGGVFSTTSSYDVRVQVLDQFSQYIADTIVSTAAVTLDMNGTKLGVGKVHERGTLDVAGPVYSTGDVYHRGETPIEPVGILTQFAGATAPAGWLLCDGTAVSRTTYAALFTVIGTTYGAGNGSSTFNLPDLRGRIPIGRDTGQTEFDVLGETGGAKTNSHNHYQSVGADETGGGVYMRPGGNAPRFRTGSAVRIALTGTRATGTYREDSTYDETIPILPPYVVVNHIIKAL